MDALLKPYKIYIKRPFQGKLGQCVFDSLWINQGDIPRDVLFRRYMADTGEYLNKSIGICIE